MNAKFFGVLFLAVAGQAAPTADAEAEAKADPQLLLASHPAAALPHGHGPIAAAAPLAHGPIAAAPLAHGPIAAAPAVHAPLAAAPLAPAPAAYHVPAPNCKTENEVLTTQTCVPSAEEKCSTETVDTEEIEYEKVCKDVVDTICDAPIAHPLHRREAGPEAEAEADADAAFLYSGVAPYHAAAPAPLHGAVVAPVAHAVAHSAVATVKHACREVTTEHCVDNPKIKIVPVEVKHCHTVTKVTCSDHENLIPKTTCEPVETTHVSNYALAGVSGHYGRK